LELDKTGQVDKLVSGQDLGTCQGVNEEEIRTAIEELNRSTDAIAKQTETLKQQQNALDRLVKANAKNSEARSELEFKRAERRDVDRKRATVAVSALPIYGVNIELIDNSD
jgi:anion-transporting  ArsA/GET3 family ATPase